MIEANEAFVSASFWSSNAIFISFSKLYESSFLQNSYFFLNTQDSKMTPKNN